MKGYKSAGVLLSLAATALADPSPSAADMNSGLSPLNPRGQELTMMGAMSKLHKRESILTLVKRGLSEMDGSHLSILFPRQIDSIPTDPTTGNTGRSNFDVDKWDQQVEDACEGPMQLLSSIVTTITDPAGVAVCYNIPFYNSTTGAFASDIRLYKIANGTSDWEAAGTKVSLSVQYEGATVRLAQAPASVAGENKVSASNNEGFKFKATKGETVQEAGKALENSSTKKTASPKTSASAATSAKPAQTPSTAALKKRMNMAQMNSNDDDDTAFEPKLLQTMRFVGQVNPDIMSNQTIRIDPNIMKLVLTPSLMLIGLTTEGNMNASVAAAQVQFATGAFSSINTPVPPAAPFVLPGVYISIFPLGLYLSIVYTILFVLIVGWGTVERYLFRMSFRKRAAMMNGKDGFGKI